MGVLIIAVVALGAWCIFKRKLRRHTAAPKSREETENSSPKKREGVRNAHLDRLETEENMFDRPSGGISQHKVLDTERNLATAEN